MRLLTWNLNGLEEQHLDERMEAAIFTSILGARLDELESGRSIGALPPDVMVFQEVTPRSFQAQLSVHLPAGGFQVRPHAALDRETFEVIAYRAPYQLRAYDAQPLIGSQYSRFVHIADFADGQGNPVKVLTGHFDSGTDSAKIRVRQLRQINALLGSHGVFAGDANLRKAEWLEIKENVAMRDAWEVLGEPADTRVTWRRDDYKARFDRIFIGDEVTPRALTAYGADKLPGINMPISDHVGLLIDFDV